MDYKLKLNSALENKLRENRQRRWHEQFANSSAPDLVAMLEGSNIVVGEECDKIMSRWHFPPTGIDENVVQIDTTTGFWLREYDIKVVALTALLECPLPLLCGFELWFGDNSPIYQVNAPITTMELNALVRYLGSQFSPMMIISSALSGWGLGIDCYCGYLEGSLNKNPDETVYELFGWGSI